MKDVRTYSTCDSMD